MSFVTSILISAVLILISCNVWADAFENILRERIIENGFLMPSQLNPKYKNDFSNIGKKIFESENISLTSNISCKTCHFVEAGSSDGLPVSAAIGGIGQGKERLLSGGKLLARNSLPLWGRGAIEFGAFFWDGKVIVSDGSIISQFGSVPPSEDPLIVALHLPVVEIREMIDETEFIQNNKLENVDAAYRVYKELARSLVVNEPEVSNALADLLKIRTSELTFKHYAEAIAEFIRKEFPIKTSRLSKFIKKEVAFTKEELNGGLIFYGKGGCVNCHSGPHFSDFEFYAIPFPQEGFGKSGFGVDYGRYSATFNPDDIYKFRTPPLWNVEKTFPYGHSGSLSTLNDVVVAHFDPLSLINMNDLDSFQRHELYKKISKSDECAGGCGFLQKNEVADLVEFLKTLSF